MANKNEVKQRLQQKFFEVNSYHSCSTFWFDQRVLILTLVVFKYWYTCVYNTSIVYR